MRRLRDISDDMLEDDRAGPGIPRLSSKPRTKPDALRRILRELDADSARRGPRPKPRRNRREPE